MARKTGGPPKDRNDEEPWTPPESKQPLNRSLDLALQTGNEDEDEPEFIYGDIVRDDEKDDPEDLVVVNVPGCTAEELEFEDETLADRNPKYPDDDDVIVTVELEILEDYMIEWDLRETPIPIEQLIEDEIQYQTFPSLRLVRVEDSHLRD